MPGLGTGKLGISEDIVVQMMISEHALIGAEAPCQGWIHNVHQTTLSGVMVCHLDLV